MSAKKLKATAICCRIQPIDRTYKDLTEQLKASKAQLDSIPQNEFGDLSWSLDLYGGLKRIIKNECKMPISTNASLKIYEMITQMKLIDTNINKIFCNAELPGAFIVAINHYIKTMKTGMQYNWLASSYLSDADGSTILGDSYGLYSGNRNNWLMGPKPNGLPPTYPITNGDVTSADTVKLLAKGVKEQFNGGAMLYTSDAGIDVSSDYNNEEEMTAKLNFGQVLCGIMSLAKGGNSVTKQFMFSTKFNHTLIILLSRLFEEFYVVKPVTSRPLNSEVYLVGKCFLGLSEALETKLLEILTLFDSRKTVNMSIFDLLGAEEDNLIDLHEGPSSLRAPQRSYSVFRAAYCIYSQQMRFIDEAILIWKNPSDFTQIAKKVQNEWLIDNPVIAARPHMQLRQGRREITRSPARE